MVHSAEQGRAHRGSAKGEMQADNSRATARRSGPEPQAGGASHQDMTMRCRACPSISRSWQAACRRSQAAHLDKWPAANETPPFCPLCLQLQRACPRSSEGEYFRALIRLASFLGNRRSLTYKSSHTQPQHDRCPSIPILHRESPVRHFCPSLLLWPFL